MWYAIGNVNWIVMCKKFIFRFLFFVEQLNDEFILPMNENLVIYLTTSTLHNGYVNEYM